MTNHVHLLLTPSERHACSSAVFQSALQLLWHIVGRPVDSPGYVLACHRYIELNPVRAGMVPLASAYRWSSHNGNTGRAENRLLSPHAEFHALSDDGASRLLAYQQLFHEGDEATFLRAIREATNSGFPLLGEKLQAEIAATGRHLAPRKPGPPPMRRDVAPGLSYELGL